MAARLYAVITWLVVPVSIGLCIGFLIADAALLLGVRP